MPARPLLYDGPRDARVTLVLAHGAGAPMDSAFMQSIAQGVAEREIRAVRFEFPYMEQRRRDGKRRAPDREPRLLDAWREVIRELGAGRIVIGGKSLGGRMASLIAEETGVLGLICLGYPFHPPGKPERLRIAHLMPLDIPALVLQGERDPFGNISEVAGYGLPPNIRVRWLADGDHSFVPRKRSGRTEADNLAEAVNEIADFVHEIAR